MHGYLGCYGFSEEGSWRNHLSLLGEGGIKEMNEGKVVPGRNLAFLEFKEHSLKTRKACPLSKASHRT